MIVFLDTSTLLKKYVLESGSKKVISLFLKASRVYVSPITLIEMINTLQRLSNDRKLSESDMIRISNSIHHDFQYFEKIPWSARLENHCLELVARHRTKSLDAIQIASAQLITIDKFVTSDKRQYQIAKKEFKSAQLIE